MQLHRFRPLAVAAVMLVACCTLPAGLAEAYPGSDRPVDAPAKEGHGMEKIDKAVRATLQQYLNAMNRGDYAAAAKAWSERVGMRPENLQVPGVSDWAFISSEMIHATPDIAHVQLNFSVSVTTGAPTGFTEGRNVRYVELVKEKGEWKITRVTASP